MKKRLSIFLVVIIIIVFTNYNKSICQWIQHSNGIPTYRYVKSLNLYNNRIFAATYSNGIFYSTNLGQNWIPTSLNNEIVTSITSNNNTIFAGIIYSCNLTDGLYFTTNSGQNWVQTNLGERYVNCLNSSGNNIYAGCKPNTLYSGGIYKSSDNGASWQATSLIDFDIECINISGDRILAGLSYPFYGSGGIYQSTNEGTNWSLLAFNTKTVRSIIVFGNYIAAGVNSEGVYISTNNGITFNQTALNNRRVLSLLYSDNKIIAGTKDFGIYISKDYGLSWTQKNEGMGNLNINVLLLTNGYLFAGTDSNSIWRRSFSELIPVQNISSEIPSAYSLDQNYPNPFNPVTKIKFDIAGGFPPKEGRPLGALGNDRVVLKVFNSLGKEVATLVDEHLQPGTYEVIFDGNNLPSGTYFYQLRNDEYAETKKLVLIK